VTLRAKVDPTVCEGHALCLTYAPQIFDMGSDERAFVTDTPITDELAPGVQEAASQCPTQAISLTESDDS
jgi:ferredoxin